MERVRHVVLVLSGKGGVGKSTVTVQLATALQLAGKRVGVLDTDLCGPSIPKMLGVDTQMVHQAPQGWIPVYTDATKTLAVMSIAFLLGDKTEAVVWRGPKKTAMIKQFLQDVAWGDLDFLVVDTPPGDGWLEKPRLSVCLLPHLPSPNRHLGRAPGHCREHSSVPS